MDINDLRHEYCSNTLDLEQLSIDPHDQFSKWFNQALETKIYEPNAMVLATASKEGFPSTRTVLMKQFDHQGIVFYTNYHSQKAQELAIRPYASATFLWKELERQVHIRGKTTKTTIEESKAYFASRPRGSQIGAWVSSQSSIITSRAQLEKTYAELEKKFTNIEIPLPPHWGGFRIHPSLYEFWQGRPNRLHDRFRYTLIDGQWIIERLAP